MYDEAAALSERRISGKRRQKAQGSLQNSGSQNFNADVNGALNIMRKSNVVSLSAINDRGDVDTPVRIRIA